jgi:hypothetical protein
MRKLLTTWAAAAAFASVGLLTTNAGATVLNAPEGMRSAIQAGDVTETVHCRPGWWHHRFRPHDGCFRDYRMYGGPSVRFSVGPRRHWGGWQGRHRW